MAEITFTGNKKLKTINSEWCAKFPYLYLGFFNAEDKPVGDWTKNHTEARAKKDASELLTTATMNVSTFESRYKAAFGTVVEIKYIKNGRKYRSINEHNSLTLSELNKWAETNGCSKIREAHPEWF
jgi:hypothetical protein